MLYFIRAGKHLKIGYSADPLKRLKELQTGNPIQLQLILTMPGDYETEKAFHNYFSKYRVEGEWFRLGNLDKNELKGCVVALEWPGRKYENPLNIKQFIENGLHFYLSRKAKRKPKLKQAILKITN